MKIFIKDSILYLSLFTFLIPRFWNILYINNVAIDIYKLYIIFFLFFFISIKKNFKINKYTSLVFTFFIVDFISCLYSPDFTKSFFYLINDFLGGYIYLIYGMNSNTIYRNDSIKSFIKVIIYIIFIFSIYEFITSYNFFEDIAINFFGSTIFGDDGTNNFNKSLGRPVSLWTGTSIDLSQSIFGLFFIQYFIYFFNKTRKNFVLVVLCIVIIIIAQSRAVLGCLILFYFINYIYNQSYKSWALLLIITLPFVFFYFIINPENYLYNTYLQITGMMTPSTSLTGRLLSLITIIFNVDILFFGYGYGVLSKAFFSETRYNLIGYLLDYIIFDVFYFAQRLVESGLIAFILYLLIFYLLYKNTIKIKHRKIKILLLSFLFTSFLAMNSTGSVYSFFIFYFIYGNIFLNKNLLLHH